MRRNRIAAYIAVMLVCSLMMSAAYVWAGETAVTDAPSADVDGKITLLLAGDIMCQSGQQEYEMRGGKFDFHREFKYVREIIQSGDIALANLETNVSPSSPLSMKKQKKYGKPYLNAPDEFMYALKNAGFDGLVNANNHNCDTGIKGLKETIESQNAYGMEHTGIFRSEKDKRYMILKEEGINVGVISYYTYMNSSKKDFKQKQRSTYLNRYSKKKVRKDIQAMKKDGADFIVVYLHSGTEYAQKPHSRQKRYSDEIAEAGADFVAVTHAHTVQPYKVIKTKNGRRVPVTYSLGNVVSHQITPVSELSSMFSLELQKKNGKVKILSRKYYPMMMVGPDGGKDHGYHLLPCTEDGYRMVKDRELVTRMKDARARIVRIVGSKIVPAV